MILSIGMIVRNEEKYLRRCLDALKPILQQVKSELIIVDTGSDDGTVSIAKEYTNLVYHFEWRDDFAAARNEAMKRAKGAWYMSLDADEILKDPTELIRFFKSGEYKKYNSATFIVRSANDLGLKNTSDFNALRLIALKPDSYYVNAVHEQFKKVYGPIKYLPVAAEHYGYVSEDNREIIERKMIRNLNILLPQLEKNPSDGMIYLNISNAYRLLKDYETALEYCKKGLIHAKEQDNPVKYPLYFSIVSINFILGRYTEAVKTADEYFKLKKDKIGTDLEVYFLKGESCFKLSRYEDAAESFGEYLKTFALFREGKLNTPDTLQHSMSYTNDASYRIAVLRLVKSLLELGAPGNAREWLSKAPLEDYTDDEMTAVYRLELEIKLMEKSNDFSGLPGLYIGLNNSMREKLQPFIEEAYEHPKFRDLILKEFAGFPQDSDYGKLMLLRNQYYNGTLTAGPVREALDGIESLTALYADLIYFAAYCSLPIKYIASKIDPSDIGYFFYGNRSHHFSDFAGLMLGLCGIDNDYKTDIRSNTFLSFLFYLELTNGGTDGKEAISLFEKYAASMRVALAGLFKPEILTEENADLIPLLFRIGFYCLLAVDSLNEGQEAKYLRYLRSALRLSPKLNKTVTLLADDLKNKAAEKEKSRSSEFLAYAKMAKESIRKLIDNGQITEAAQFLKTYETLCPGDSEIEELNKEIKANTG